MKKKTYQQQIDEILTPEVIEAWKKARAERMEHVKYLIMDEDELFLEELYAWIGELLDECYQAE